MSKTKVVTPVVPENHKNWVTVDGMEIPMGAPPLTMTQEEMDQCVLLRTAVHPDLALSVEVFVMPNGAIEWAESLNKNIGFYNEWRAWRRQENRSLTPAQRATLTRLVSGKIDIFGIGAKAGKRIRRWLYE